MNENVIALDGPAGTGKSTVARELATRLGYKYLDSGAFYRALTLYIFRKYKKARSKESFQEWVGKGNPVELSDGAIVECIFSESGENKIFLNGEDVSLEIRIPEITKEIKHIANKESYREFVNKQLRNLALIHKLIMDGRDIGTAVFPDARYKFFLTASSRVRAERRYYQLKEQGIDSDLDEIEKEIIARDKSDTDREIAPLKQAKDAILIDTDRLPKNTVIGKILECLEHGILGDPH
ncbi:cytidylate kinase [Leptospira inadai serovar Lyme str. 10]|uniref:Cytidylate kinase n=2 Tax=Leptospira inadai serovar Lyme TaxID=293084 RepID=V6HZD8_9LEPT|nr:(d)CMP kinase [Leptospira inadai]EQA38369.1 cytidylate kinase [Leptospira inadai serovar Lyme str. 10]PNV76217.1 (d)CMP kinase [Leptospira inadai serovar Lyme]